MVYNIYIHSMMMDSLNEIAYNFCRYNTCTIRSICSYIGNTYSKYQLFIKKTVWKLIIKSAQSTFSWLNVIVSSCVYHKQAIYTSILLKGMRDKIIFRNLFPRFMLCLSWKVQWNILRNVHVYFILSCKYVLIQ